MLISVDRDESRAAVVEDGQLVHLEIEPVARNTCKGNIYRAVVARVEPSLQSAFVDFGNDKQGFLPVGEIHPKLKPANADRRAPIQELLRAKQEILVQVVRDEIGQKGATLSTFISLPGRYLVLIPESDKDKAGVSRKLSDEAREHVRELTDTMKVPEGFGLIVRTAGETASKVELAKDLLYLSRQWTHIQEKFESAKGPTLLYAERSLPVRFVRDYFTKDIEEVVIDDDATLHEVGEFLQVLMPRGLSAVVRYAGDVPLFARYGIEGKVDDVFARQVFLPSGGSIVIDQTEAMVAIDVNSGRMKEKDIEETARATNIEAAQEIARQMILRDMGGLIVVDFIDMREKKYVREVEQAMKDAFKDDKARTKIAHISDFGLMEMSRQRIKSSVNKGAFDACPHCSGTGRLRAMDSVGMSILRRIYELVAQKKVRYVIAMVPPATARYLLNARRTELAAVERQYHMNIEIVPVDGMTATQVILEHMEDIPNETGAERADRHKLLRVTQELDLVRNQLIKREEVKIQLEAAATQRGAKVDYAELYKEVREMAPPEDQLEARGRRRHGPSTHVEAAAIAAAVPAPVLDSYPELEHKRSFWSKIGEFLGFSEPPKAEAHVVEAAPAAALAAAVAVQPAAPPARDRQERGEHRGRGDRPERFERGDRRDRHDRGDRPDRADRPERGDRPERADRADRADRPDRGDRGRPNPRPAEEPAVAARPVAVEATPVREESSDDADVRRGRRRRRRRGGRSDGDTAQGAGAPGEAAGHEEDEILDGAPEAAEELAGVAPQAAAEPAQGDGMRRRRRRGGRGGDRGHEGGAHSEREELESAPEEAGGQAEAEEVTVAASGDEVATATPNPEGHTEQTHESEEESVDARSLIQAEMARLRMEQAQAQAPETAEAEPAAAAAPEPAAEPKPASKRFVVDLRTGSR